MIVLPPISIQMRVGVKPRIRNPLGITRPQACRRHRGQGRGCACTGRTEIIYRRVISIVELCDILQRGLIR